MEQRSTEASSVGACRKAGGAINELASTGTSPGGEPSRSRLLGLSFSSGLAPEGIRSFQDFLVLLVAPTELASVERLTGLVAPFAHHIHWKLRNHLLSRWSCKVGFAVTV